jgi:hypothetical protein
VQYAAPLKSPFRRPEHRWKDCINIDLKEIDLAGWIRFMWLMRPVVGCCEHNNEALFSVKGRVFLD